MLQQLVQDHGKGVDIHLDVVGFMPEHLQGQAVVCPSVLDPVEFLQPPGFLPMPKDRHKSFFAIDARPP